VVVDSTVEADLVEVDFMAAVDFVAADSMVVDSMVVDSMVVDSMVRHQSGDLASAAILALHREGLLTQHLGRVSIQVL
jgi:hypothetical protein